MNGNKLSLLRCRGSGIRIAVVVLAAIHLAISGCAPEEPPQPPATNSSLPEPRSLPPPHEPAEVQVNEPPDSPPQIQEDNEETVWAKGFRGQLIEGLDGELYEPYNSATIERTQRALRDRGLYAGPVNGILGIATMKAIFEFQKANYNLQLCGVPTPLTRKLLQQGSHTDPIP